MAEKGFEPLTSQLGIPGTSYRIQLGLINGKWASRLLKGTDVIDSYVYKDEDLGESGFPNQNLIVGWVIRTVAIPNINPHQIMKTVQALVKQALEKKDQRKAVAPLSETKQVELEKVPDSALKRPQTVGWVKEEDYKSAEELEDEKRQAFKERMKVIKGEKTHESSTSVSTTLKTTRELPTIPRGEPVARSEFCPHCGKDLDWKYCPYCGGKLPH
ncbi:MAG: zinc ribbon domain-containing protein [Candidatus Lokiarchaeota archaeon]|nr:zinc ribbon domain-containing protein [Candidatus Lokiarchaeota archaeon]